MAYTQAQQELDFICSELYYCYSDVERHMMEDTDSDLIDDNLHQSTYKFSDQSKLTINYTAKTLRAH